MTTNSPRKACVFCNGDLKDSVRVKRIASNCDLLIAADGGARLMVDLGLKPGIVIGDLNSATRGLSNGVISDRNLWLCFERCPGGVYPK